MPALGWIINLDFAGGSIAEAAPPVDTVPIRHRRRIPHPDSPVELRQAFQRLASDTDVITIGTTNQVLIGQGVGVLPVWGTDLTALTSLIVDNITIDAATIVSDSGAISFDNENLTTTGTISGVNVTSGSDPGHTHTGASLGSIDISDDTNLTVSAPVTLTNDDISWALLGIESLTDPGVDRILFWDDGGTATGWLQVSTGLSISGTVLTVKDGDIDHDALSGFVAAEHVSLPNTITNVLSDHTLATHKTMGLHQTVEMENEQGATIYIGFAVYASDNDKVKLTDASDEADSIPIGLVADSSIANTVTGTIRTAGILTATTGQWDTCGAGTGSGLVAGTKYYLGIVAGTLSPTRPTQPTQFTQVVGIGLNTTDMLVVTQKVNDVVEQITGDLTIYVSTTGNDVAGIGDSGSPLATLTGALSFLGPKLISSTATVTIQIADGTYTETVTTPITHANGDRIVVVGENSHDISMASIQSSSGGVGAWAVIINVDDVSNAAVGDYLLVPGSVTGGTRPLSFAGAWKITNVDVSNTRLTVTSTSRYTSAPAGAVSATVTIIKTILQYNGCHGLEFSAGSNLGSIDKVVISGNDTAGKWGMLLNALSVCTAESGNFAIAEWLKGVEIDFKSVLKASNGIISGCAQGVVVVDGSLQISSGVISGCSVEGIKCLQGNIVLPSAVISGCAEGVDAQINSSAIATSGQICYNIGNGLRASLNTYILAASLTFTTNGTNASPAVNTLGNTESYITWT